MQVKRRLFSYPIINKEKSLSTYTDKIIELKFETEENKSYYILKDLHFECNSSYVLEMIERGEIIVKCIIECPYTIFKKTYIIKNKGTDLPLLKNDLAGKIEISLIAYANKDFLLKSSEEFDEDYQNIEYSIKKAQILGIDDGFIVKIFHNENSDNLAHSIFSIIRNETSDSLMYETSIKTNKIEISLSRQLYEKYLKVYNIDEFAEEFFCALLVPALNEGLHECLIVAKEVEDIESIVEVYTWFNSILDAYKRLHGIDLTLDMFKEMKMNSLAQELLGNPINKALDEINLKVKAEDDIYE